MIVAPLEGRAPAEPTPVPTSTTRKRREALRHGLMAESIVPDDMAGVVAARTVELNDPFMPRTPYEQALVTEIARALTRIDNNAKKGILDLQRTMDRAVI